MPPELLEPLTLIVVLFGAAIAGFISGFAGFGVGLTASGFWFQVLPAHWVPPLIVLVASTGQLYNLRAFHKSFDWPRVSTFVIGGIIGIPLGIWFLTIAEPKTIRLTVGLSLIAYAAMQLFAKSAFTLGTWGGKPADAGIGTLGGVLSGFAGLSGPPILIWTQLRGGSPDIQRATYQPYNLAMLLTTLLAMALASIISKGALITAAICLPVVLFCAWAGTRLYKSISAEAFRRIVLLMLLTSGFLLIGQSLLDR